LQCRQQAQNGVFHNPSVYPYTAPEGTSASMPSRRVRMRISASAMIPSIKGFVRVNLLEAGRANL
jgi:hypothetical protein